MFPLRDVNPTKRFPILTYALIAANVAVFLWQLSLSEAQLNQAFFQLSVVPRNITADPYSLESALDIFRSMFFHGGWAHLGGNMLYLYLFGDNVEDYLGKFVFVLIYFGSGIAAVAAQVAVEPLANIPLVGASGAIAGVLGSYLVLYPRVRVEGIVPLLGFGFFTALPAWIVLGFWFVVQLFNGVASIGVQTNTGGGVAFFAHVGGFMVGLFITFFLMLLIPHPGAPAREQMLYDRRNY